MADNQYRMFVFNRPILTNAANTSSLEYKLDTNASNAVSDCLPSIKQLMEAANMEPTNPEWNRKQQPAIEPPGEQGIPGSDRLYDELLEFLDAQQCGGLTNPVSSDRMWRAAHRVCELFAESKGELRELCWQTIEVMDAALNKKLLTHV